MIDPAQMSQSQSFTTEEMSQIKAVQQKHLDIQLAFGQIHVAEIQLEEQLEQLDVTREQLEDELQLIRDEETALVSKINQKYGEGVLDQKTGTFTPAAPEAPGAPAPGPASAPVPQPAPVPVPQPVPQPAPAPAPAPVSVPQPAPVAEPAPTPVAKKPPRKPRKKRTPRRALTDK
jgi:outer membrane biosynthesis protein TonB|tara:strand:- start:3758 stop:4282 length:525 start_codon:yes stop_codon:yes gene_type:complete